MSLTLTIIVIIQSLFVLWLHVDATYITVDTVVIVSAVAVVIVVAAASANVITVDNITIIVIVTGVAI